MNECSVEKFLHTNLFNIMNLLLSKRDEYFMNVFLQRESKMINEGNFEFLDCFKSSVWYYSILLGRRRRGRRFPNEKSRISRYQLVTIGGWSASPAGPCSFIEIFNYLSDSWRQQSLESPGDRAYASLEVIDDKVNSYFLISEDTAYISWWL